MSATVQEQVQGLERRGREAVRREWAAAAMLAAGAEAVGRPLTDAELARVSAAVAATKRPAKEFADDVRLLTKLLDARQKAAALPSSEEHAMKVAVAESRVRIAYGKLTDAQNELATAQNAILTLNHARSSVLDRVEMYEGRAAELLELLAD